MRLPFLFGDGSGGSHEGLAEYLTTENASRTKKVDAFTKESIAIKGSQFELFCQGSQCLVHCGIRNVMFNAGSLAANVKNVDGLSFTGKVWQAMASTGHDTVHGLGSGRVCTLNAESIFV